MKLKNFKFPHAYALLFMIIIIASLASYVVPAGEFDRIKDDKTGKTIVIPDSYHSVEGSPIGFFDIFVSVQKGMLEAADIIFFVFIIGGAFGIIQKTGAINAGLGKSVKLLSGREALLIPGVMLLFALGGATFGMYEETLPFAPIAVGLAIAIGFDAVVGVAMVLVGVATGFAAAILNPFTVQIAQKIAELPLLSGMELRVVFFVLCLSVSIHHTYSYAMRIKKDPEKSLVRDLDYSHFNSSSYTHVKLEKKQILVLIALLLTFVVLVIGVKNYEWYINELAGLFLILGIAAGLLGRLKINEIAEEFVNGAKDIAFGALIVGIARAVLVVLQEGRIIDTLVYALSQPLILLPKQVSVVGMLVVQSLINFFPLEHPNHLSINASSSGFKV